MAATSYPFEPTPDGRCRICRGPVDTNRGVCTACGTVYGERHRCPHCRSITRTTPHPVFGLRCGVCGKPRLHPLPLPAESQDKVRGALARAAGAHRSTGLLGAVSGLSLSLSALTFLGTLGLALGFDPGAIAVGLGLSTSFITGLVGFGAWRGSTSARRGRDSALADARVLAASALLEQSQREASATTLGATMGLSAAQTDQLMTSLNIDDRFVSRVTDDGEIVFSLRDASRVRIADELLGESPSSVLSDVSAPLVEAPVEVEMVEAASRNATAKID
jgi:hypothetical protein